MAKLLGDLRYITSLS